MLELNSAFIDATFKTFKQIYVTPNDEIYVIAVSIAVQSSVHLPFVIFAANTL